MVSPDPLNIPNPAENRVVTNSTSVCRGSALGSGKGETGRALDTHHHPDSSFLAETLLPGWVSQILTFSLNVPLSL